MDRKKLCQSADLKKRVKFGAKEKGLTAEMMENHDILFNMEINKEINQFENSNLCPDSRLNSKLGFMRQGSHLSSTKNSINRHISSGMEMNADEESFLLAKARSRRTRSTAATNNLVNVPDNLYSTP